MARATRAHTRTRTHNHTRLQAHMCAMEVITITLIGIIGGGAGGEDRLQCK